MKRIVFILVSVILFSASACKKCYKCNYPPCYVCQNGYYGSGTQYCSGNYTQVYMDTLQSQCAAQGGTWIQQSQAYSTTYCQRNNSNSPYWTDELAYIQDDCISAGGTWTLDK
ncbi:MAG TPA: hypothetical protein VG603_05575 [Chitinophagales bacterium]|nr:hypothetical protein [Chitinophagales bacterium]